MRRLNAAYYIAPHQSVYYLTETVEYILYPKGIFCMNLFLPLSRKDYENVPLVHFLKVYFNHTHYIHTYKKKYITYYEKNFQYTKPPRTSISSTIMTIKISLFVITLQIKNNAKLLLNKTEQITKHFYQWWYLSRRILLPLLCNLLFIYLC